MTGASPLRRVLAEFRTAGPDRVTLDGLSRRLGVSRSEVEAMIDYWVQRGRLTVDEIGRGCTSGGCGSCPSGRDGAPGCGSPSTGGPVLLAISLSRRDAALP